MEAYLTGHRLSMKIVEEAVSLLEADGSPIDDLRSARAYRLDVSRNLLRAFLLF